MDLQEIKAFFDKYIYAWMCRDIKICVDNNANFGAMTLMCCGIDFLGSLAYDADDSKKRFKDFVKEYFDKKYGRFRDILYDVYRNGVVHQYFPKQNASVAGKEQNRESHLKLSQDKSHIVIHAGCFFDDFKKAIEKYQKHINSSQKLQSDFNKRTKKLLSEKVDTFDKIKKSIKVYNKPVCDSLSNLSFNTLVEFKGPNNYKK